MSYDVEAIRKKLAGQKQGRPIDPDEFRPAKADSETEPLKYRFYILPPIVAGDKLKGGIAKKSMDLPQITHGYHWINKKPFACPRCNSLDPQDCPVCQFGFDLLAETPATTNENKDKRKTIVKEWMPNTSTLVNIYFPNSKINPEELRGKVKFFNAPKTCADQWEAALNRNDCGDPEDPQAFGAFFDENAAFVYQLEAVKQAQYNSYKSSKFITTDGKPQPIIRDEAGVAMVKHIKAVLEQRIDLFSKVETPDMEKLKRVVSVRTTGDDGEEEAVQFDKDETEESPPAKEVKKTEPAKSVKSESKAKVVKEEKPKSEPPKQKTTPVEVEDTTEVDTPDDDVPFEKSDDSADDNAGIQDLLAQLRDGGDEE